MVEFPNTNTVDIPTVFNAPSVYTDLAYTNDGMGPAVLTTTDGKVVRNVESISWETDFQGNTYITVKLKNISTSINRLGVAVESEPDFIWAKTTTTTNTTVTDDDLMSSSNPIMNGPVEYSMEDFMKRLESLERGMRNISKHSMFNGNF